MPTRIERVATKHAPARHQRAFQGAMFVNRLISVMGAGRVEAASVFRQAARDGHLVETDQCQQQQARPILRRTRQISQTRLIGIFMRQVKFRLHQMGKAIQRGLKP